MTTITTDLDLNKFAKGLPIPKESMRAIGEAFRLYRHNVIRSKRQLHDLSAMPPLKPETIKRKSGAHTGGSFGKSPKGQNFRRLKSGKVKPGARGRISPTPDVPLMDTGNMAAPNALNFSKLDVGLLEIVQGPSRADIQAYHQAGAGHLPQRVSLSWNSQFLEEYVIPIINNNIEQAVRKARGTRTVG